MGKEYNDNGKKNEVNLWYKKDKVGKTKETQNEKKKKYWKLTEMPELRKSTDLQRVSITGHSLTSIVMLSRTPFFVNVNTAVWAVIRT